MIQMIGCALVELNGWNKMYVVFIGKVYVVF